jgi:hypothetical protein
MEVDRIFFGSAASKEPLRSSAKHLKNHKRFCTIMLNHEGFRSISVKPQGFCHMNVELQMVLSNVWGTSNGSVLRSWNLEGFCHIDAELKGFCHIHTELEWFCLTIIEPGKVLSYRCQTRGVLSCECKTLNYFAI